MNKTILGSIVVGRYGGGLADQFLDEYVNFRYNDGFNLSDRVWRLQQYTQKSILDITTQGIMSGISAVELAKQVEGFLLKRGPAWTTGIKRSVTGRGTVAYNALRLARTEINQAYHWVQKEMAKENPMLIGQKWNLSNTHPTDWPPSAAYMGYPEICDYYAKHDHHGLGEGVFPPGEAPPDHPNGLCYLTDVWKPVEEILDLLGDPDPDWVGGFDIAEGEPGKLHNQMILDTIADKKERAVIWDEEGNRTRMTVGDYDSGSTALPSHKDINTKGAGLTVVHTHPNPEPLSFGDIKALSRHDGLEEMVAILPDMEVQSMVKLVDGRTLEKRADELYHDLRDKLRDDLIDEKITREEFFEQLVEGMRPILEQLDKEGLITFERSRFRI